MQADRVSVHVLRRDPSTDELDEGCLMVSTSAMLSNVTTPLSFVIHRVSSEAYDWGAAAAGSVAAEVGRLSA